LITLTLTTANLPKTPVREWGDEPSFGPAQAAVVHRAVHVVITAAVFLLAGLTCTAVTCALQANPAPFTTVTAGQFQQQLSPPTITPTS